MNTNTLILYQHPFAAFCWKPLIALYELELPFESKLVENEDGRAALRALWPLASMPVLRDETADVTLPESSVIIEYLDGLIGSEGRLIPQPGKLALPARLWDRVIDDFVAIPMQQIVGNSLRAEGDGDPTGVGQARDVLDQAYGVLEHRLAGSEWAGGATFTIADCAAVPALFYARAVHPWDEDELGNLTRYYRALMHRPSIQRVLDEARPYRDLFPMTWPENVDAHQPDSSGRAGLEGS